VLGQVPPNRGYGYAAIVKKEILSACLPVYSAKVSFKKDSGRTVNGHIRPNLS
jgi:hypothetical protein